MRFQVWKFCQMTEAKETELSTPKNAKLFVVIQNIDSAVELSLTQQTFLQHLKVSQLTSQH